MTTNPRLKEGFTGRMRSAPCRTGDGSARTTSPFFSFIIGTSTRSVDSNQIKRGPIGGEASVTLRDGGQTRRKSEEERWERGADGGGG